MGRSEDEKPEIVTLTMCETGRMSDLERALEYAINRADGRNFVLEGVRIDEVRGKPRPSGRGQEHGRHIRPVWRI